MCALNKMHASEGTKLTYTCQFTSSQHLTDFVQILLNENTFSFQVRSWLKSHMERCDGPYQDELVINAAVKVQGEINWIHTRKWKKTNVIQGVEEHFGERIVIFASAAYAAGHEEFKLISWMMNWVIDISVYTRSTLC